VHVGGGHVATTHARHVHLLLPARARRRRHTRPLHQRLRRDHSLPAHVSVPSPRRHVHQRVQDVAAVRVGRRVAARVHVLVPLSDVPRCRHAPPQRVAHRRRQRRPVRGRLDAAEGHEAVHAATSATRLRHHHRRHRRRKPPRLLDDPPHPRHSSEIELSTTYKAQDSGARNSADMG